MYVDVYSVYNLYMVCDQAIVYAVHMYHPISGDTVA